MKKNLLFFLSIFVLLLIPKDTFAADASFTFTPGATSWRYTNSLGVQSTMDSFTPTVGNLYVDGYFTPGYSWVNVDNLHYFYNGINGVCTQTNSVATIEFNFISYPISLNAYPSFIITQGSNNNACSVVSASESNRLFKVMCPNVVLNNSFTIKMETYTGYSDITNKLGVSSKFDVTCSYNASNSTTSIINNNNNNTNKIVESNEKTKESIDKNTEEVKKQTETIKDDDTSKSEQKAAGFFNDFKNNDYGLSDIITMPLTFIKGLSNSTCSSLNLPLPFVEKNATLPCMTSVYQTHFGSFLTIYQTITTGIIAYWCCINIFRLVQGFKDPDSDEIEVMDL